MGKKRVSVLGTEEEQQLKSKQAVKLEQKKLRAGKTAKPSGLKGGQRVVDTADESLREYEEIQKRTAAILPAEAHQGEGGPTKTKRLRVRSKPYQKAKSLINSGSTYPLPDALSLLRQVSLTKFDPTVELHLTLKETGFKKEITLPHLTGKTKRIAIATDEILSQIEKGQTDFDVLLATPSQMSKLVKLAKILGPKGLMPNPKNGTLIENPEAAAKKMSASLSVLLKTEKDAPAVHTIAGKLSSSDKALSENISAILSSTPNLKKAVLKSTMSPAIKLQI